MYLIDYFVSTYGWKHKIKDRALIIPEFKVHGVGDLPIKMANEKQIEQVSKLDPLVFTTAFKPDELIESTNLLPRTDKRDGAVISYATGLVDQLKGSEPLVDAALGELTARNLRNKAASLITAGVCVVCEILTVMFGGAGMIAPMAMQAQAYRGMLEAQDYFDVTDKFIQKLTGSEAVIGFNSTMVYEQLDVALVQKEIIDRVGLRKLTMQEPEYDEEGRLLDCVDEVAEKKDAKRVMVPYDFIESILPLVGLFVIMEAFFGGVRSIRNSYDTQGFKRVQAQFKFNAQFRYWIIFYYPAQIHIFKAFRYINIASNDPRD